MIPKSRARSLTRTDAKVAEKIILVQEAEIDHLKAQLQAQDAIITALLWGKWDYVTETGEVIKVQWRVPKVA